MLLENTAFYQLKREKETILLLLILHIKTKECMLNSFNNLSLNDDFWIQIKGHLISFGFKGLPKDVHFTIFFGKNSPAYNFHVTKNISDTLLKPRIGILTIERKVLDEVSPASFQRLMYKLLQPIDLDELIRNSKGNISFLSFDSLKNTPFSNEVEERFTKGIKEISRIRKKKRIKIEGNIGEHLEKTFLREKFSDDISNYLQETPTVFDPKAESYLVQIGKETIPCFRINDKWYKFSFDDFKPMDILTGFVRPELARMIIWRTKRAIVLLKYANFYGDVEYLHKPLKLTR